MNENEAFGRLHAVISNHKTGLNHFQEYKPDEFIMLLMESIEISLQRIQELEVENGKLKIITSLKDKK